ncbi:MAG TPA: TlpA disulfide reductase family protein [Pyrinomonadaceae bacterium]|nr:TlpA disulfide reductase family protein [Pyrinomonadaceae bacterium]
MKFNIQPRERDRAFWTPVRSALTLTALVLVAALSFSSCGGSEEKKANAPNVTMTVNGANAPKARPTPPPGPTELPAAALETNLKTLDGKPFKLADVKGKVLVIDLWATWCGPCRYEVPELVNLQKEFGPRGLQVVGLNIDPDNESETPERVRAFAKEFSINYQLAYAERDLTISLMRGGNIPQSLVIGRDGRVVEHLVGFSQERTPKRLRDAIERALQ